MRATNLKSGKELSDNVVVADSFFKRMKGLIGRKGLQNGEALWITPCYSIHTFCMKFPIDVVFLNKRNRVVALVKNIKPNRITRLYLKAISVLELPSGTIESTATKVEDQIEII
jgi:uncharacterized membrane protein (UPF0127 family)